MYALEHGSPNAAKSLRAMLIDEENNGSVEFKKEAIALIENTGAKQVTYDLMASIESSIPELVKIWGRKEHLVVKQPIES